MADLGHVSFEDCCKAFADSYEVSTLPAMLEIEQSVLGCNYGGTSWTTAAQADLMADELSLGPGDRLLDIGSGTGWPALYLANGRGSAVTLLDLPQNALAKALSRATNDGTASRVSAVAASGAALPFADRSFSAISHSDVLCCLPDKVAMLDECRRVSSPGARMVFGVIFITPGLAEADYRRALDAGPPFIESSASYEDMLGRSGWEIVDCTNVNDAYRNSVAALVTGLEASEDLRQYLGDEALEQAVARRNAQIDVIDLGLMQRLIYSCRQIHT